jgi:hypothetical protein
VPASECGYVTSCASCDPVLYVCVVYETQLEPYHHCVELPKACQDERNCDCLGMSVCVDPFWMCTDPGVRNQVKCQCPEC